MTKQQRNFCYLSTSLDIPIVAYVHLVNTSTGHFKDNCWQSCSYSGNLMFYWKQQKFIMSPKTMSMKSLCAFRNGVHGLNRHSPITLLNRFAHICWGLDILWHETKLQVPTLMYLQSGQNQRPSDDTVEVAGKYIAFCHINWGNLRKYV